MPAPGLTTWTSPRTYLVKEEELNVKSCPVLGKPGTTALQKEHSNKVTPSRTRLHSDLRLAQPSSEKLPSVAEGSKHRDLQPDNKRGLREPYLREGGKRPEDTKKRRALWAQQHQHSRTQRLRQPARACVGPGADGRSGHRPPSLTQSLPQTYNHLTSEN